MVMAVLLQLMAEYLRVDKMTQTFSRDGFSFTYKCEGTGIPAIVIGDHQYYLRVFPKSLRKKLKMIFVDHRGFAQSPLNYDESLFALEKIISDIEYLRKTLGLEKVIIIGHSIHALIAIEYTKQFPSHILSLVLIAASPIAGPRIYSEAEQYFQESVCPIRKKLLADNLAKNDEEYKKYSNDEFVIRMLKFAPMIWYNPKYEASHLWQGVELNPQGAAYIWGKMFENYSLQGKIDCPTFIALGRYDYWNPPHLWNEVRACFTDLTMRIFEKSAHTPMLEEPMNFNKIFLGWIKDKYRSFK